MAICNDLKNILKCLFFLGLKFMYIMELKCLNFKSKVPDIFGKNNLLFVHSVQSVLQLQYKKIQRFVKTWHALNFNFTLNYEIKSETRIFYLCTNVTGFLKKFLSDKSEHIEKRIIEGRVLSGSKEEMRWLGRGNQVARNPPLVQLIFRYTGQWFVRPLGSPSRLIFP